MDLSKSFDFFNPKKNEAQIHIVGCGSVGSTVAENLARCGVTKFTLWDFDIVEEHNLVNQMFVRKHINMPKVEALKQILLDINPEIESEIQLKPEGWHGDIMSGYIFMCVDDIEVRKAICNVNMYNPYIKAVFDFRTGLTDAQHFAADWSSEEMKKNLVNTMNFTNEEADAATPMSACHVALSVAPTIRVICAYGVSNFINFVNGNGLHKMIVSDAFNYQNISF